MAKEDKKIDSAEEESKSFNAGKRGPGKRKSFKGKRFADKGDESRRDSNFKRDHFANDPAWYKLNPSLIANASKVSFGNPMGLPLEFNGVTDPAGVAYTQARHSVPGFMVAWMVPTMGSTGKATDPINVSAKSIYSWVRHANSGHANYDFPDLQMYLLAMREVYAYAGWVIRLIGLINKYSVENRLFPQTLLDVFLVDGNDLAHHQPDLLFYINNFAKRANALSVPRAFPMYQKAFNMYANVFKEGKSIKDQLYAYSPCGFLHFDATTFTTGSALKYDTLFKLAGVTSGGTSHRLTANEIMNIGDAILAPLLGDEDIGIMSGDIRKAFDKNVYLLGDVPDKLVLEPVVDSFELQIIHNIVKIKPQTFGTGSTGIYAYDYGYANELPFGTVVQDTQGNIIQRIAVEGTGSEPIFTGDTLIDIDSAVPTEDEVVEASLYKAQSKLATADTELATYASIVGYTGTPVRVLDECCDYACVKISSTEYIYSGIPYEWAPFEFSQGGGGGSFNLRYTCGQFHNFTILPKNVLTQLHTACMLSMLAVPAVEHIN